VTRGKLKACIHISMFEIPTGISCLTFYSTFRITP
jgi:hypothetical protein